MRLARANHPKLTLWSKCLEKPTTRRGVLEVNTWAKKDFKEHVFDVLRVCGNPLSLLVVGNPSHETMSGVY